MLVQVGIMQEFLQDGNIRGMFGKPVKDWSLIIRILLSGGYGGGKGGWSLPYLVSALVTSIAV